MNDLDCDVVVIGGGPAGCTAASYLARDGYKVILLEKDRHPRHRIGESLLPSMMPILVDFGLVEECERRKFAHKPGATFTWGKDDQPWHLKWKENPFLPHSYSYHVDRSSFDQMLSDYARSVGVDVRQDTRVVQPLFADGAPKKIVGVQWEDTSGQSGALRARFVVDASGSASVIGKAMSTRRYDEKMKQVAFYTYFNDVAGPTSEDCAEIRDHIVITTCPYGWFWWIPINSEKMGYVSMGLVSGQEFREQFRAEGGPEKFFWKAVESCPQAKKMLGERARQTQPMRSVVDWSYCCDITAGDGFFLCGDAAAFLDPLISTGVSLAMLSAFSASVCINTILRDPESLPSVTAFYQRNYQQMYEVTRDFLHYFYAGATSMHKDELFWKGRKNLRVGENVAAQQAFTYFTAIIPGNPHPAVTRQVSLFKNMLNHVDFPQEKLEEEGRLKAKWSKVQEAHFSQIDASTCLSVNGALEQSYVIDEKNRRLLPTWGVAYDKERPVLSNTASWLMGGNFFPVDAVQARVLAHLDGKRPWGEVRAAVAAEHPDADLTQTLQKLCELRLVLQAAPAN
jgi:flavin-dependent dehydrogenase